MYLMLSLLLQRTDRTLRTQKLLEVEKDVDATSCFWRVYSSALGWPS